MKIHVLMENTSCSAKFLAEHGLSLLIETGSRRILFDTGASPAFADNAERLRIDLNTVDAAVLSHGHYDHGGGISRFLQLNQHAPVWISPHAFLPHFNASGKDIGLAPELAVHERLRTTHDDITELYEGITLHSAATLPNTYPAEGAGMETIINGQRQPDDFRHEQYLLIQENGKRVLISGCSHRGILNIATHFRADVLVGGFHFMKASPVADAPRLQAVAELLLELPTCYHTGHCTGDAAFCLLKQRMGERL
jgi:7,8-dihydropterin-6-yl-methyl-4-(beta-D-ribofuranosyl)aminobenzene 5'-phosphate synthase